MPEAVRELRLLIGDHHMTIRPGEVAELDTQVPHWFGTEGERPVEILSLLSKQDERIHLRVAPGEEVAIS